MTYISNRIRARHRHIARARPALSGITDVVTDLFISTPGAIVASIFREKGEDPNCITIADTSTAALDAKWQNIAQNWNPTGRFSPSDMNAAITMVVKVLSDAQVAVNFAPPSTSDSGDLISQALDDINKRLQQMAPYAQAVTQAQASGATVINSPNFKTWITTSLVAASGAFATRAVLDCRADWIDKASSWFDQVTSVVMKIVDVVETAAETTIDVVGDTFSMLQYVKWVALGVGAWWLWANVLKPKRAS